MGGGLGGMGGGMDRGDGTSPGAGSGYGLGMGGPTGGEGGYGVPIDGRVVIGQSDRESKVGKDSLQQLKENKPTDQPTPFFMDIATPEALAAQLGEPKRRTESSELADGMLPFDDRRPTELKRTIELQRLNDRLAEQESRGELTGKQSVNRLYSNSDPGRGESTLMMTVSPAIIIPEEEEEKIVSQTEDRFGDATKSPSEPMSRFVAPKLEKSAESDKVMLGKELKSSLGVDVKAKQVQPAKPIAPVREIAASAEPFSTFSLHVSDVSFQLAQSALNQGQWPARATLRPEEFLNAFDYQDPTPNDSEMVACQIEQATHPFQMQRNLVRIAMKTGASGRALNMPLRLTVLLDISGSMERHDRKYAIQKAFQALASQLRDQDQITLIAFANTPRLIADRYNAEQARTLSTVIEKTPSQGGTNIEAALTLAREKAREQFVNGGQNRIVMLTDGAVNLGNADPSSLSKQIVELRNEGIAFDAAGICAQDLNDEVLEALTRQGDGRYYLINADDSTAESFSKQLAGALRPTAKNVKVQVEFNPQRVGQYLLIGFEKHQLKKEDFRNDRVDAAELAAAEAGVAMYQVEVKPDGVGDVGSVSVRFQDVSTGQMIERRWPITYNAKTPSIDATKPAMQLATASTLFALKLTGEPSSDRIDFSMLSGLVSNLQSAFANQPRVQALLTMINQARSLGEPPQVGN
jgi:Mg-chelatase subunit ChlD